MGGAATGADGVLTTEQLRQARLERVRLLKEQFRRKDAEQAQASQTPGQAVVQASQTPGQELVQAMDQHQHQRQPDGPAFQENTSRDQQQHMDTDGDQNAARSLPDSAEQSSLAQEQPPASRDQSHCDAATHPGHDQEDHDQHSSHQDAATDT